MNSQLEDALVNKKTKILLIGDFPNWAYHEIIKYIVLNLSDEFDFYVDFLIYTPKRKSKNPFTLIKNYIEKRKYTRKDKNNKYDIVFFLAFYFEDYMSVNWEAKKCIKGIFTDGFPPSNSNYNGDVEGFVKKYFKNTDAIVCGSKMIQHLYNPFFPKVFYANMTIDENFFFRKNIKSDSKNFVIGWTGNPNRDFKGFYSHVVPVVEYLKMKYDNIEFKTRFSGPISTLPEFYVNVDLIIIASDADAGPSLFAEASLLDVPSVSTNIGWPSEVIINGVNGFIVEKEIQLIIEKVEFLYLNRDVLLSMSSRIRIDFLKVFNKHQMLIKWKTIFNHVLKT